MAVSAAAKRMNDCIVKSGVASCNYLQSPFIYLTACDIFHLQYVGETMLNPNRQIN